MKRIPLTQGKFALVDDVDYPELSKFNWHIEIGRYTFYAARRNKAGQRPKHIKMHQQLLQKTLVDHINGNGLDNRRNNLRQCTPTENQRNRRKQKGTLSRFKGITWHAKRNKWQAQIKVNKRNIYLGLYVSEKEAANAYDTAANNYFAEFAKTNKEIKKCSS